MLGTFVPFENVGNPQSHFQKCFPDFLNFKNLKFYSYYEIR